MRDENCIKIWRFYHAPARYAGLSDHGGDEDWVAFVPTSMLDDPLLEGDGIDFYLGDETPFAPCRAQKVAVPGGLVIIGAHA